VEALPDLKTLSDAELRALIRTLIKEEQEVSYRRRLLHGKIDILRAELVLRLQAGVASGTSSVSDADLDRLTEILAVRAAPRLSDDELDGPGEGQG
jgi:hypothetical protein